MQWLREQVAAAERRADELARDPFEGMSDDELHQRRAHPAYEYETTEGQRKAWEGVDDPPWDEALGRPGEGWELNITSRDPDAFERFDYTEERYWRRLRPDGPRAQPVPREALDLRALCDAHTAILDHVERYGVPVVEMESQFDGDFFGRTFVALRAQELVRYVGIAYRHNPNYDEFVAALTPPEVTAQLSDTARADELAPRRSRREDEGSRP